MINGLYDVIPSFVYVTIAFLISLTVHEFSHALMATFLGDDTARRQGRLSLNPLVHIDPLGLLFLLLVRVGWAKPVPFDHRNFKHPRAYAVLTACAGPLSNIIVAFICLTVVNHVSLGSFVEYFFSVTAYINTMLGIFNLVPITPLDGGHFVEALFGPYIPKVLHWLRRYGMFLIIILFYTPPMRAAFSRCVLVVFNTLATHAW